MERIASFEVDHNKLQKGIYISRVDDDIITYDLRVCLPNAGIYLDSLTSHTMEHLMATYLRNSKNGGGIIYFGPMGCRTGFYLLTRGLSHAVVIELIKDALVFISEFTGEIPGNTAIECGNYLEHDLATAKDVALEYGKVIENWNTDMLDYNYHN